MFEIERKWSHFCVEEEGCLSLTRTQPKLFYENETPPQEENNDDERENAGTEENAGSEDLEDSDLEESEDLEESDAKPTSKSRTETRTNITRTNATMDPGNHFEDNKSRDPNNHLGALEACAANSVGKLVILTVNVPSSAASHVPMGS